MKKTFIGIALALLLPFCTIAKDIDEKEIVDLFKKIEDTRAPKINTEKPIQDQINELNSKKALESAMANQNEFNEKSLNSRISKIVYYYSSKLKSSSGTFYLKGFGYSKMCEGLKCEVSAYIKQKEIDSINEKLSSNKNEFYTQKIALAKGLYSINPLATRKTKIEEMERELYASDMQNQYSSALTGTNNNNNQERTIKIVEGEEFDNLKVMKITPSKVVVKGI